MRHVQRGRGLARVYRGVVLAAAVSALLLGALAPGDAAAAKRGKLVVQLVDRAEARVLCPLAARQPDRVNANLTRSPVGRCVRVKRKRVVLSGLRATRVVVRSYGQMGAGPCFSTRRGVKAPCKAIRIAAGKTKRIRWEVPRMVTAKTREGTLEVETRAVVRVAGDPTKGQTVVLRATATRPRVGSPIVVPVSARARDGVLGIVTGVRRAGGTLVVATRPAALDQVYRDLKVQIASPVGLLQRTAGNASAAQRRVGPFTCSTAGFGPQKIDVNVDLRPLTADFDLDVRDRYIYFLLAGTPKIDVDASIQAKASCRMDRLPQVGFFVPGTPVHIGFGPAVEIGTESGLSANFKWRPRIVLGFHKGRGHNQDFKLLNPRDASFDVGAGSSGKLFLGAELEITAGGRIGLSGQAGPEITATGRRTANQLCRSATASMKLGLKAIADVFITRWTFPIASGNFGTWQLLDNCTPQSPGPSVPPGGGGGEPPPESGGGSPDEEPEPAPTVLQTAYPGLLYEGELQRGTNVWDAFSSDLPPGLRISSLGLVSGVPPESDFTFTATWMEPGGVRSGTFRVPVKPVPASFATGMAPGLGVSSPIVPLISQVRHSPEGRYTAIVAGAGDILGVRDALTQVMTPVAIEAGHGFGHWIDNLAWSPDGTKLAFDGRDVLTGPVSSGLDRNVHVYDANTLTSTPISMPSGYSSENPSWSPDGELLAFHRVGPDGYRVVVHDVATGTSTELPCDEERQCRFVASYDDFSSEPWSSDSRHLAYLSYPGETQARYYEVDRAFVWDRDAGSSRLLADDIDAMRLDPTGSRAMIILGGNGQVVDIRTGAMLSAHPAIYAGVDSAGMSATSVWSPDGRYVSWIGCSPCAAYVLDTVTGAVASTPTLGGSIGGWHGDARLYCTYAFGFTKLRCEGLAAASGERVDLLLDGPAVVGFRGGQALVVRYDEAARIAAVFPQSLPAPD